MTAAQALVAAIGRLRSAGIEDAARDARRLLAHAARIDAARVSLIAPEELSDEIAARFDALIERRAQREPVSHLTGRRAFYGRDFHVSRNVLDPRPETELVIEAALGAPFEQVLDLGTGSGCILVTLLAEETAARGIGVDLSEAACLEAAANAVQHGVDARARFIQSDWFVQMDGQFDLIVSNPPYIAADEMAGLAPEVQNHEPRMALTDEADGLTAYSAIANGVLAHLVPGGRLVVEIGPTQAQAVSRLFEMARLQGITVLPDLDGRDRVIVAHAPAE